MNDDTCTDPNGDSYTWDPVAHTCTADSDSTVVPWTDIKAVTLAGVDTKIGDGSTTDLVFELRNGACSFYDTTIKAGTWDRVDEICDDGQGASLALSAATGSVQVGETTDPLLISFENGTGSCAFGY